MTTTAIVTGGAGGMGLNTAELLGRDHHVFISDVHETKLERATESLTAAGVACTAVRCDVTDRRAVDELVQQANRAGRLMSVVHTAGLSPQMAHADTIARVNALGTVNVVEAVLPFVSDGAAVVNVASTAGHMPRMFPFIERTYALAERDPDRFISKLLRRIDLAPAGMRPGIAYAISKNFVIWYSQTRAAAFGARGARILSVSPGSFDTEMGRLEAPAGAGALAGHAALKRFGRVEEIAEVLAFCAGTKPGYLTGTDLLVDGGAGATMSLRDVATMARHAR